MSTLSVSEDDRAKIIAAWGNVRAVCDAALATNSLSELNLTEKDGWVRAGARIAFLAFDNESRTPEDFIAAFEKEVLNEA